MHSSRNMNKSTPSSTVFNGSNTEREVKLSEILTEIPTLDAEPLIDDPNGSIVFRGADYNREMYLQEVAPHMANMSAKPLVDTSDDGSARVFRGTDTRREIPLKVIAPNLVEVEKDDDEDEDGLTIGERNADTSMVFRGADTKREALLRTIADNLHWDEEEEDKYMQRVKAKALERVNMILAKAKKRAEEIIQDAHDKTVDIKEEVENRLQEAKQKCADAEDTIANANNTLQDAETIKANAYDEGYNAGLEQARIEAEEAKKAHSKAVGTILLSIHGQCITIFNSWREDLTQLLYEAVEKSSNYVLDTEKKSILENLLDQSTNVLLEAREYTLKVNPEDVPMIEEIFMQKHKNEEKRWKIKADENLASGGVIIESPSGLIKNTQEERASIVDAILARLSLPLSQGDQDAYDAITNVVIEQSAKAEIILNEEKEEEPVKAQEPEIAQENIEIQEENAEVIEAIETAETNETTEEIIAEEALENRAEEEEENIANSEEPLAEEPLAEEAIAEEIDIEDEAKQMVDSGLHFDASEEQAIIEEDELDAMEMDPPFADKMSVLSPPAEENTEAQEEKAQSAQELNNEKADTEASKEEIADEILDAMGFSK